MTTPESPRRQIEKERRRRETLLGRGPTRSGSSLVSLICEGGWQEAVQNLIFFVSPGDFSPCLETVHQEIRESFNAKNDYVQANYIRFMVDLTLSLRSFLPHWNLQNANRYDGAALTAKQVEIEADKLQALAVELAAQAPNVSDVLLAEWQAETAARFEAESAPDPQGEAAALIGDSVGEYLDNLGAELARSHLRRISEMRAAGHTRTELSNDYAAFLQYALYLGASFVTCNPPLVDVAWVTDPERWNHVVDCIIANNRKADEDELARLVTLEVVLASMRLLQPIFVLTEGQMGCVCLQVNPKKHDDAAAMISDALFIYEILQTKMDGSVPNVVFKLPGTQAGLGACRALTKQGIGVTITVNFGLFQHLPFTQAIHEGQAIFACLVEMNGRLAYPVRDELVAKLDELGAYGIDEARAREAAAWSGVAVVKRLHRLLDERGYDLRQIKSLIASLRIYQGHGYQNLPSAFPDITETIGASVISVFPNIRRAFDAQPRIEIDHRRIDTLVPEDILEVLTHSEIFKQAYYVADRDWMPEGDDRFRPDYELTLEDESGTATWAPVHNTLTEFCDSYDTFVQRILERKRLLYTE